MFIVCIGFCVVLLIAWVECRNDAYTVAVQNMFFCVYVGFFLIFNQEFAFSKFWNQ